MPAEDARHNSYDRVPYLNGPYRNTHPRHLETVARLLQVKTPPIPTCRVLELGCAGGANLIPQAYNLPEAEFLGVDFSRVQIEEGQRFIRDLGLKNIELRHADVLDIDESYGQFDYIIAHGIYSWVPAAVQRKILEICRANLSESGVAVVSYNTYPGWHIKSIVRELMLYHTRQFDDPRAQIREGGAVLDFLIELQSDDDPLNQMIRRERDLLSRHGDAYLFHEFLEPNNRPCYFYEFLEAVESGGLQYLSEVDVSRMLLNNYSEKIRQTLDKLPQAQREQYLDFLTNRCFRASILAHAEVAIERRVTAGVVSDFYAGLVARPEIPPVDLHSDQPAAFKFPLGTVNAASPLAKAAMAHLCERYPEYVPFRELRAHAETVVREQCPERAETTPSDLKALASTLLVAFAQNMVDLCVHPPRCTNRLSARPTVLPLARAQAGRGPHVTNTRHEQIHLDRISREVLLRLDGRHDRPMLADAVRSAILQDADSGDQHADAALPPEAAGEAPALVERTLTAIRNRGLLVE